MTAYVIPGILAAVLVYGLVKGTDVFQVFLEGAREGLKTSVGILPALIALMVCVGMFRASGGLELLLHLLSPVTDAVGMPESVLPLALLRPLSGSGALAVFEDLLRQYGADSTTGRIASVLMGSTETTFYTLAVYYGAVQVRRTRHTLIGSLSSDLTGFLLSGLLIRLLF